VLRGDAPAEYKRPERFFANTYPTKGIKNVLKLVALRVSGHPDQCNDRRSVGETGDVFVSGYSRSSGAG